jgi:hypothetical protein
VGRNPVDEITPGGATTRIFAWPKLIEREVNTINKITSSFFMRRFIYKDNKKNGAQKYLTNS